MTAVIKGSAIERLQSSNTKYRLQPEHPQGYIRAGKDLILPQLLF